MHPNLQSFQNESPKVAENVYIAESARVIGRVTLKKDVSIWPMCVLRGDVNFIEVGARTNIQDGSILHVTRVSQENPQGCPLIIDEDVTIGHRAMLHGCHIHARVLVGMGAILLDQVVVESEVMIGAGALVTPKTRLISGYLYLGSPAKQARSLTEQERAYLHTSAHHYLMLKNQYLS